MKLNDPGYNRFSLVKEMYETVDYIRSYDNKPAEELYSKLPSGARLMLTGEGSSRIFPAKNALHHRLMYGSGPLIFTESSTDLSGKILDEFVVIGASNSGKTRELINLFRLQREAGHHHLYGLTCNAGSLLEQVATEAWIVDAGPEKAVAATKSVVAQALFYDSLLASGNSRHSIQKAFLAKAFESALNTSVADEITGILAKADTVYFAGFNNGVGEELTLKTNEIIRKKSAFLPGTYLLHGVEEIISPNDVIVLVDTWPEEFDKIGSIYPEGIGTPVIALSADPVPFLSIPLPETGKATESYIKLASGWNMLVEAGIRLGIDMDKPERARKIGNEATG